MSARRFFSVLRAELKRSAALALPVLLLSLLLLGAIALLGLAASGDRAEDAAWRRIRIGVVGDVENDSWLRLGFYALEHLDPSRFSLDLEPMGEAEAASLLRKGALDAYVAIPEGFAEAVERGGEVEPVRYVSAAGDTGLGAALTRELVEAVSALMSETENAIYGAQDYLAERVPDAAPYAAGAELTREYLSLILDRDSLFETETAGWTGGLSYAEYYLCAFSVLFPLLWGVACGPVFARRHREVRRLLRASGAGAAAQALSEYLAYLALLLPILLLVWLFALGLAPRFPEIPAARFALRALVPALMLAAMQLVLFELSSSAAALPLQFLVSAGMAYVSGLFYPASFFPERLRRLGEVLPSGAAFAFCAQPGPASFRPVAAYLAVFLALLILLRRWELERSGA